MEAEVSDAASRNLTAIYILLGLSWAMASLKPRPSIAIWMGIARFARQLAIILIISMTFTMVVGTRKRPPQAAPPAPEVSAPNYKPDT